jgi:hypothetical protein
LLLLLLLLLQTRALSAHQSCQCSMTASCHDDSQAMDTAASSAVQKWQAH